MGTRLPEDFSDILEGLAMMYGASIPYDVWEGMDIDPAAVMESSEYIALVESINNGEFDMPTEDPEPTAKRSPRLRGQARIEGGFQLLDLDISVFDEGSAETEEEEWDDEDDEDVISEPIAHTSSADNVAVTYATRLEGEKRVHIYL